MFGLGCSMPNEEVYSQIVDFARRHGARRVVLYGSRARGTNSPKSDIDIAVAGCEDFGNLYADLQDDLWSLLSVDVVNLDTLESEALLSDIRRDGKVLYEAV